jgi:hypothetical protein
MQRPEQTALPERRRKYWISTNKLTAQVNVDDAGYIVWTAPVLAHYRGQSFERLKAWVTFGLFEAQIVELTAKENSRSERT